MEILFRNIILSLSWAIISFIFVFASFVSNIARCLLLIDEFLNNIPVYEFSSAFGHSAFHLLILYLSNAASSAPLYISCASGPLSIELSEIC